MFIACCSLLNGHDTEPGVSCLGSSLEREQFLEEIVLLCSVLGRIPFPSCYLFHRLSVF